jgi:methyl-accepting chemotaxis protein
VVGQNSRRMLIGAVAFMVACGIVIAPLIARGISRPIVAITRTMSALAAGDTDIVIPAIERRDKVGQIGTVAAGEMAASINEISQ